jgi:signal transduction histidine kinase
LQDEERRRIARGLHDSLGQYLTALKINLNLIPTNDGAAALVAECADIVEKCLSETRTISHLLHPPLLDEAGLKSALQWCVEGFAQRSGVKVNLNLPCELGRFHKDIETALFRVVQEALTNVHRHSHASEVNIRLTVDARYVGLIVDDNGRGIPDEKFNDLKLHGGTGVGLAGMRERVRDLGGSFGIESKTGTSLRVSIPIANTTREEAPKTRDHKESSLHSCGNLPS